MTVAESIIRLIANDLEEEQPIQPFVYFSEDEILRQAQASALRYKTNTTLGPLDGVPVVIKDESDVASLPSCKIDSYSLWY